MEIPDDFKIYCKGVVDRHFNDATTPDGTTEKNREHLQIKDAAYNELRNFIAILCLNREDDYLCRKYAEEAAQRGIYDLFQAFPVKKNKRYKGAKDWLGT